MSAKSFSKAFATTHGVMPDRLTIYLGVALAALAAFYMALIITTVFFATLRTEYASNAQTEEANVGVLEEQYFTALAAVQSANPVQLGYVTPTTQSFVTAPSGVALTLSNTGN